MRACAMEVRARRSRRQRDGENGRRGLNHPSPSFPLPVEGRGRPDAGAFLAIAPASVLAKMRAVRAGASGSLSSIRNGGAGCGEEALRKVGPFVMVKHPSPLPSPRSCLTGRGRRTRCLLPRSRDELSQRLIAGSGSEGECPHDSRSASSRRRLRAGAETVVFIDAGECLASGVGAEAGEQLVVEFAFLAGL